jgi:hypothetical protein
MAAHLGGLAGGFLIGLPLVRGLTPAARVGKTGRAVLTGAAAAIVLAGICAIVPRAFSLSDEMIRIAQMEDRVGKRLGEIKKKGTGASIEQLAVVEGELVPQLEDAYQRIRGHRDRLGTVGQKQAGIALEFLDKHRQAARMMADGLRSNDQAAIDEADRTFEATWKTILGDMKAARGDKP